jgi:23S rRNA (pseudouridine1915-N3)-methyltransferase
MAEGVAFYLKRLKTMAEAREIILKGASVPPGAGAAGEALAKAKAKEAAAIAEHCRPGEYLIILDVLGRTISSPDLAKQFEKFQNDGVKAVNLVVGGPWGVDENLLKKADLRLSFGPMTFPHELARVMLLEQVYRAYAIMNNLPYHKE